MSLSIVAVDVAVDVAVAVAVEEIKETYAFARCLSERKRKDGEKIPAGSLFSYYRLRRANYMLKDDGAAYLRCYEARRGARARGLVRGRL